MLIVPQRALAQDDADETLDGADETSAVEQRRTDEAALIEDPEARRRAQATALQQESDDADEAEEIEERRSDEAALIEDPEAQRRALALAAQEEAEELDTGPGEFEPESSIEFYGSARVHVINNYDVVTGDQSIRVGDGNSRAGARAEWEYRSGWYLYGRGELGFNLVDNFTTRGAQVGDDDFDVRLGYVGIDHENLSIVAGRNWSAYYQVAGVTDRFAIFGGSASGVYNARTAGNATGTGRADEVIQGRLYVTPGEGFFGNLKPFRLNLQYQLGQQIPFVPGEKYDFSYGASAFLETNNEYSIGIAYNRAEVPVDRMAILNAGIDGDASALAFTTRAYSNRWYAALLFSRLRNMEVTNEGRYFNGTGIEFYAQWEFKENWWLIGGANVLEPDSDDPDVGAYRVRYAVIGGRYSFDSFRRMIYVEHRLDDGRLVDGSLPKNELTIGVRWDFGE